MDDWLSQIRIGPTVVDYSTPLRRDLRALMDEDLSFYDILSMARKYLPNVRIHKAEGVTSFETKMAVGALLRQRLEPREWESGGEAYKIMLPTECNHIVLAHGAGSGNAWYVHFKGASKPPMKVQDFVDSKVPKGERAFCVVCKDGQPESFSRLTGECLVSRGNEKQRM